MHLTVKMWIYAKRKIFHWWFAVAFDQLVNSSHRNYSKFYLVIKETPNNTKQNTSSAVILQLLQNGQPGCFDLNTTTLKNMSQLCERPYWCQQDNVDSNICALLICCLSVEHLRCCTNNKAHAPLRSSSEKKKLSHFSFPPKCSNEWGRVPRSVKPEQTTAGCIINVCSSIHNLLAIRVPTSTGLLLK